MFYATHITLYFLGSTQIRANWDWHHFTRIISLTCITSIDFQETCRIITIYDTALTTDLKKVQKKSFQRDGNYDRNNEAQKCHVEPFSTTIEKTCSRRFKRRKPITTNDKNTDICPVLNVSSVTLENSETSLLSKAAALTFAPLHVKSLRTL